MNTITNVIQRRRITVDEWNSEGVRRFGKRARDWQFVCPHCQTIQSAQDYMDAGLDKETILGVLAYSCVGRFTRSKGCDWTLGGLFQIHTLEIVDEAGKSHPRMEFADIHTEP